MATTYLQNTHTGTGSNTGAKATMSVWVKRTDISGDDRSTIVGARTDDSNYFKCRFADNDRLMVYGAKSGSANVHIETDAEFRDVFGWYHVVLQIDTASSTETERVKWYVNGELQPIRSSGRVYPSQNDVNHLTSASDINIGCNAVSTPNEHFDGSMSHFHMIDGTIYPPTAFGSTDSTTGEWKINTSPSVTYGAKGYFILKDGNSLTDASPNTNNFTLGAGTLTKTLDNPSNVFATLNSVLGTDVVGSTCNFSNGNTVAEDPNGSASGINPNFISTLGMPSKGKWYCELQPSSFSTSSGHSIGIYRTKGSTDDTGEGDLEGSAAKIRYIFADTAIYIIKYGTNDQTGLTAITSGQTVGMALDLDNGTLQYYVNGSTRANAITGINSANDGFDYFFHAGLESSSSGRYGKYSWNFGNGAFGSTQLTGTTYQDSQGRGIFKHQPPTNFLALCTKNLNV